MKKSLLFFLAAMTLVMFSNAQVTQLNDNNSLHVVFPLSNGKTIVPSDIDNSLWATDATAPGTIQISPDIKYEASGGVLGGKFYFTGSTAATGSELYVTDGTSGGTSLVSDIYPGATSSTPGDFSALGGFLYFSARTAAEGRELWRTDGTTTTLVKDIVPGTDSSNSLNNYHLSSNNSFLIFAARTPATGVELWISDGTPLGTVLLKDINTGNGGADSSSPRGFYPFNNLYLFVAKDNTNGEEPWVTDGTPGGTVLLKNINPGSASSTGVELFPGVSLPVFLSFHTFNNKAYFNAFDGVSAGEIWSTDGTPGNTTLLKDVVSSPSFSFVGVFDAVNLPGKFMFPVSDLSGTSEIWQSDGTPGGTVLFKSFVLPAVDRIPVIFIPFNFDFTNNVFSQQLFQGNKFFFTAATVAEGYELWISDGTLGGTNIVKDINPGAGNGIDTTFGYTYVYTTTNLFFAGNDGVVGNELWKTDGTTVGTTLVKDINPLAGSSNPELNIVSNGKIIFSATDGNSATLTDLFVVDGTFSALPTKLTDFTATLKNTDALLSWKTSQELNSKNFTIERSFDARHFEDIGIVQAVGNSSNRHAYTYTDVGVVNNGKDEVYYRLRSADKDGKSEHSNVVNLKIHGKAGWNVRLLSNPVKDNVSLLLNGINSPLTISISDINGRTVYTGAFDNINGQISLPANLQRGTYILSAEMNRERRTLKFVK